MTSSSTQANTTKPKKPRFKSVDDTVNANDVAGNEMSKAKNSRTVSVNVEDAVDATKTVSKISLDGLAAMISSLNHNLTLKIDSTATTVSNVEKSLNIRSENVERCFQSKLDLLDTKFLEQDAGYNDKFQKLAEWVNTRIAENNSNILATIKQLESKLESTDPKTI